MHSDPIAASRPGFGEPLPFFTAETDGVPRYSLEVAAGKWMLLLAFGSLSHPASEAAHAAALKFRRLFDDRRAAFYGISVDPQDRAARGLTNGVVGWRYFWDFDHAVCRTLGIADAHSLRATAFLIDPGHRVALAVDIDRTEEALARLEAEVGAESPAPTSAFAPVLQLDRVFEPEFCAELVAHYDRVGGRPSGFAAEVDGLTGDHIDTRFKRRADVTIADPVLLAQVRGRLTARVLPMVKRAFGFEATQIERDLIARYDAREGGGFFSAHRDDATPGTAHRRFALTVSLSDDYEGGALRFPEFGRRAYRPTLGGAVAFSCSLLHEVTPVTRGVHNVLVPFLFDEAAARLRRANLSRVEHGGGNRKARRSAGRR